jgi:hypothetical protein
LKLIAFFATTALLVAGSVGFQSALVGAAQSTSIEAGSIQQISCAKDGACVGVGEITNGSGWHPFIFEKIGNRASHIEPLKGPVNATQHVDGVSTGFNVYVNAVSCSGPTDCVAGGSYTDTNGIPQPFIVEERGGEWKSTQEIAGNLNVDSEGSQSMTGPPEVSVTSISCSQVTDCVVVGNYVDGVGNNLAFRAVEKQGVWGRAKEVGASLDGGAGAQLTVVSCGSSSDCVAGGSFTDRNGNPRAFLQDERGGVWGNAFAVGGRSDAGGEGSTINSISCVKNGDCVAGGQEEDDAGKQQAFVEEEMGGVWRRAREVAAGLNLGGIAAIESISCSAVGSCVAGGYFETSDGYQQAFVVSQTNGAWSPGKSVAAQLNVEGKATINAVSCVKAGYCEGGGEYQDRNGNRQAFIVDETHGAWQSATEVAGNLNGGGNASVSSVVCMKRFTCTAAGPYLSLQGNIEGFIVTGSK